jgi:predicted RNase H-like HicB family nuclease
MSYTLIYWQDGEWLVGRLRERPDVFSQGETMEELEENIRDALKLMEETELLDVPPNHHLKEIQVEAH